MHALKEVSPMYVVGKQASPKNYVSKNQNPDIFQDLLQNLVVRILCNTIWLLLGRRQEDFGRVGRRQTVGHHGRRDQGLEPASLT
jgi:hypothetical protein